MMGTVKFDVILGFGGNFGGDCAIYDAFFLYFCAILVICDWIIGLLLISHQTLLFCV